MLVLRPILLVDSSPSDRFLRGLFAFTHLACVLKVEFRAGASSNEQTN